MELWEEEDFKEMVWWERSRTITQIKHLIDGLSAVVFFHGCQYWIVPNHLYLALLSIIFIVITYRRFGLAYRCVVFSGGNAVSRTSLQNSAHSSVQLH